MGPATITETATVDAETIALVGLITTGIVGLGGLLLNFRSAERDRQARNAEATAQREHIERLARAERYHRMRERAYADGAAFLELQRLHFMRIGTAMGWPHKEPEPLPDLEFTAIAGRLAVTAPDHVREAIQNAYARGNLFVIFHATLQSAAAAQTGELSAEDEMNAVMERQKQINDARDRATAAIDEALGLMREDLAGL